MHYYKTYSEVQAFLHPTQKVSKVLGNAGNDSGELLLGVELTRARTAAIAQRLGTHASVEYCC